MRYETPAPPAELGDVDGLAYSLWLPEGDPWAGVVILHGAGSTKENHHDFARAARSAGLSAVCFDQRGHGETGGALDGRVLDDVATRRGAARRRADRPARLEHGRLPRDPRRRAPAARRRWSRSARRARTACGAACAPASSSSTPTSRRSRRSWPSTRSTPRSSGSTSRCCSCTPRATSASRSAHSRELARVAPRAELVVVPGGHHRSVQHDAELQGHALRWLRKVI